MIMAIILFTSFAPLIILFAGQLMYDGVNASSASYIVMNTVVHFGKEIQAEYTIDDFYIISTIQEMEMYRCARHCMRKSGCNFVNYVRRFHMCIIVGSKWNNLNWEEHVVKKPGSVLVVKSELLSHGWINTDISEDCGPQEKPQYGEFQGNMFTIGSKIIHTCETKPDRFVTYKCVSGVWSVVPVGSLTEPCCDSWNLNQSCYFYDPDLFKTIHAANKQCKASGGYLIHIETMEEQNLIRDMMKYINTANDRYVLIGLTDEETEGVFKWLGETTETIFTQFSLGQPEGGLVQNCVVMVFYDKYRWHDLQCDVPCPYICEYEWQ